MALNQLPYSNVHELNLDWILKKLQDFETELAEIEDYGEDISNLQSAVSTLETNLSNLKSSVTSSLTALNSRCTDLEDMDDTLQTSIDSLYASVESSISDITDQYDAINAALTALRSYNDSSNLVTLNSAKAYTNEKIAALLSYFEDPGTVYVTNPWTAEIQTIQDFVNYLYSLLNFAGLSAEEFDALGLTATEFDSLGLTAQQFDMYGKWAMFFSHAYVTSSELTEILANYATQNDISDMATTEDLEDYATLTDVKVIDPTTGINGDVQTALINLAALMQNNLTATQFDDMELTATEFDSLEITAFAFDFYGYITFINAGSIDAVTGITANQWANIVVNSSGQLFTTVSS